MSPAPAAEKFADDGGHPFKTNDLELSSPDTDPPPVGQGQGMIASWSATAPPRTPFRGGASFVASLLELAVSREAGKFAETELLGAAVVTGTMSSRKKYLALAALLLAGCATVYDLENRAPDARYVSNKPMATVAQCITQGVASLGRYDVQRGDTATFITLQTQNGYPAARITVRSTQTGSNVSVRQTISYSLGRTVERCL